MVSLWWLGGGIVVFVCTIFGCENFPRFADLFLGGRGKATAIDWSLRPSGFAPAFGRAVHAFRRELFAGAKSPALIRKARRLGGLKGTCA
jgi:hypothetical protein